MKKIIFVFLLTLFIPTKVEGAICKYSEIARLKKIASNINYSYDYVETDEGVTFTITLVNLHKDIYVFDEATNTKYDFSNNELVISNYKPGISVKYEIYATAKECNTDSLYTIRVNLPTFNRYYKDAVCNGIENYSLCQKWSSHNLTYEVFLNKVEAYKQKVNDEDIEEKPPVEKELTLFDLILNFFFENYFVMLMSVILFSGISIYFLNKKDNVYSVRR